MGARRSLPWDALSAIRHQVTAYLLIYELSKGGKKQQQSAGASDEVGIEEDDAQSVGGN